MLSLLTLRLKSFFCQCANDDVSVQRTSAPQKTDAVLLISNEKAPLCRMIRAGDDYFFAAALCGRRALPCSWKMECRHCAPDRDDQVGKGHDNSHSKQINTTYRRGVYKDATVHSNREYTQCVCSDCRGLAVQQVATSLLPLHSNTKIQSAGGWGVRDGMKSYSFMCVIS